MVAHYWVIETSMPLISRRCIHDRAQGIRVDDLIHAVERRGWSAWAFPGDPALVTQHLRQHRPLIVLIEDRPGRLHYVVVVAWDDGGVVVHDPARARTRSSTLSDSSASACQRLPDLALAAARGLPRRRTDRNGRGRRALRRLGDAGGQLRSRW